MPSGNCRTLSISSRAVTFALLAAIGTICSAQASDTDPLKNQAPAAAPQPVPLAASPRAKVVCPTPEEMKERYRPLSSIQVKLAPTKGTLPLDCSKNLFTAATEATDASRTSRNWAQIEYQWHPTELAHQPLYFDDVPLERYGQTISPLLQPVYSGVRFFGSLPVLPYKVGLNGPWERVSTLGYYRPGSPTPCVRQILPLDAKAAFIESGAWVGLLFLL